MVVLVELRCCEFRMAQGSSGNRLKRHVFFWGGAAAAKWLKSLKRFMNHLEIPLVKVNGHCIETRFGPFTEWSLIDSTP